MENKMFGNVRKVIVETAFEDLSFTFRCMDFVFKFNNDERNFPISGPHGLRVYDMETVEKDKKFITSFKFSYFCKGTDPFGFSVHHYGKIYKVEAFQEYSGASQHQCFLFLSKVGVRDCICIPFFP